MAVDASVAVPLLLAAHEHHAPVAAWASGQTLALCGHALVETYAVLTRLPGDARVSAADAARLIDENFAEPLALSGRAARHLHQECAARGVTGGATYDGLVAMAAREHDAVLVTRDARAWSTYETVGATVEVLSTDGADQ